MKTNLIMGLAIFVLLLSCNKTADKPNCLGVVPPLNLNFNLLDKESKKDLFFSENPEYSINDIKIFNASDEEKKKPLTLNVETIQGKKHFSIVLNDHLLENKPDHSIIFVIGSSANDNLAYSIKMKDEVCPEYTINQIKFNQNVINPINGIYAFLK